MSESTHFKMTTVSTYGTPEVELNYILHSHWDAWRVDKVSEVYNEECTVATSVFVVIIFELNEEESRSIVDDIKQTAEELGVTLTVGIIK